MLKNQESIRLKWNLVIGLFFLAIIFVYFFAATMAIGRPEYANLTRYFVLNIFSVFIGLAISVVLITRFLTLYNFTLLLIALAFLTTSVSDVIYIFSLPFYHHAGTLGVFSDLTSYGVSKTYFVAFTFVSSFFINKYIPKEKSVLFCLKGVLAATFLAGLLSSGITYLVLSDTLGPRIVSFFSKQNGRIMIATVFLGISLFAALRFFVDYRRKRQILSLWIMISLLLSALHDIPHLFSHMMSPDERNLWLIFRIVSFAALAIGVAEDYFGYLIRGQKVADDLEKIVIKRTIELENKNRELEQKTKESEQASRLKSELLANMSHELRTPMNAIIGFTNRVIKKSEGVLAERQFKNLKTVEKNAHHLLSLINSILDVSKVEAGRMEILIEPFQVHELVEEVVDMTMPLVGNREVKILHDCPKDLFVNSDRTKIKQMIINLVGNSLKFTEEGGVKISARRTHVSPFLNRAQQPEEVVFGKSGALGKNVESFFQILVSDTGIGIKENDLKMIFDEFHQVDGSLTRKTGGTGLGLTIVKQFSHLLGGGVEVSSSYGKGTCFTITLPVDSSFCVDQKSSSGTLDSLSTKTRILCLSENKNHEEKLKTFLNDFDIDFKLTDNLDQLPKKIKSFEPKILLIDFLFSQKSFFEIIHMIKSDAFASSLYFSGYCLLEPHMFLLHLNDYLTKPFSRQTLVQTISKLSIRRRIEKIMFIDDDTSFHQPFREMLDFNDYELKFLTDCDSAKKECRTFKPDLIFLSPMIQGTNGLQFLNDLYLDDAMSLVPVVFVTTRTEEQVERAWIINHIKEIVGRKTSSPDQAMRRFVDFIKIS